MGKQQSQWKLRWVVMQSLWNRHERRVNAVQSPWKHREVVMQTFGIAMNAV
jgi:hypothetical protein